MLLLLSHWYTLVLLLSVVLLTLASPVAALTVALERYPIIASIRPQNIGLLVRAAGLQNAADVLQSTTVHVTFLSAGTSPTPAPYNPVVNAGLARLDVPFTFANPGSWRLEIRNSRGGSVTSVTLDFLVFDPASGPRAGQNFSSFGNARITASNDPTPFCLTGLPNGLSFDAGVIKGTPATAGTFSKEFKLTSNNTCTSTQVQNADFFLTIAPADPGWQIVGVGDFNGDDSTTDILWRHASTGQVFIWLTNGAAIQGYGSPGTVADPGWQIVGVGDFNNDGTTDILWRHAFTGQVFIWLMDRGAVQSYGSPGTVADLGWQIVGVGDLNRDDGTTDILWHHAFTGQVIIWLMNGTNVKRYMEVK